MGIGLTFLSLVMFSGTYVINRYLREANSIVINAQNTLFSFVIGLVMFVLFSESYTFTLWTVLAGSLNGVLGFACGLMFIMASQL